MSLFRSALLLALPLGFMPAGVAARFHVQTIANPEGYSLDIFNLPNFGPSVAYEYPVDPFSPLSPYPVLYQSGKVLPIPPPPAGYATYGVSTSNNVGELLGYATRSASIATAVGITYKDGKWTVLDIFPNALNDRGDLAGVMADGPFLQVDGKTTVFGVPPSDPKAIGEDVVGVNNARQIAGESYDDPYSDHVTPFLIANGRYSRLAEVPGALNTEVIALNQTGTVLVNWTDDAADIGVVEGHAALLTADSYKDVGQLPGAMYLEGTALDDFGDVVGQVVTANDRVAGFLYADGKIQYLSDLVDTDDYYLSIPTAINDLGEIAVMMYRKSNLEPVPAILTPICPSSLGSVGLQPASAEESRQNAQWCRARR